MWARDMVPVAAGDPSVPGPAVMLVPAAPAVTSCSLRPRGSRGAGTPAVWQGAARWLEGVCVCDLEVEILCRYKGWGNPSASAGKWWLRERQEALLHYEPGGLFWRVNPRNTVWH